MGPIRKKLGRRFAKRSGRFRQSVKTVPIPKHVRDVGSLVKDGHETIYWYEGGEGTMGQGFFAQVYTHVGQWGTHCDPPAHFAKGKRTIDQIDPKEMVLPLVVIDVHEQAANDPDYTIRMDDVRDWKRRHSPIPEGTFVAMRTDWSKRWPDAKTMRNEDDKGVAHYRLVRLPPGHPTER